MTSEPKWTMQERVAKLTVEQNVRLLTGADIW
jgi:hypothetical protein